MSITAAQRKKDPHAGPGDSFPEDAAHLKAAWDLAGHAANPEEVRAHILAFAKRHGMMDHLPATAKQHMKKADIIAKATGEDMKAVMAETYRDGDNWTRSHMIMLAHERGLKQHLPAEAHSMMHDMSIPHEHEGITNKPSSGKGDMDCGHEHMVTKAMPKIGFFTIEKAYGESDDCFYEGWLSTPARDLEKDVTEPEAFVTALPSYFARRAPVSVQHGTEYLPAGHLQKAVVVRDGNVLASASHPTDAAEFEHFPESGSGVWVRGRLTESPARNSVRKGNCGGMSFIAMATEYTPLAGGGRRITKINPLQETTVAPYPVNSEAVITVAKAFGLSPAEDHSHEENNVTQIDEILAKALEARQAAETPQDQTVSMDVIGSLFLEFEEKMATAAAVAATKAAEEAVMKALPARGEGAGRKGGQGSEGSAITRDADPVKYMIKKALDGEQYDAVDEKLLNAMTWKTLGEGLADSHDDDDAESALTRALNS